MTREEAIEHINIAINRTWKEKKCNEILDALKQEPCDAVSRKAAIDACLKGLNRKEMVANIKALPSVQPKQTECEDCIGRQAVLNTLDNMDNVLDEDRTVETYKMLLTECVNVLPSVTPAEKVGHWMQTGDFFINKSGQFVYQFICSECSTLSYFRKSNKKIIGADICPNCGSYNGGGDNGNE